MNSVDIPVYIYIQMYVSMCYYVYVTSLVNVLFHSLPQITWHLLSLYRRTPPKKEAKKQQVPGKKKRYV